MLYLTTHSTHFIYGYMASDIWLSRKEMLYLTTHSTHFIVKDHSDSERGNPLPPRRLLFPISSKVFFI